MNKHSWKMETFFARQMVDAIRHCLGLSALYRQDADSHIEVYPERCLRLGIAHGVVNAASSERQPLRERVRRGGALAAAQQRARGQL